MTQLLVSNVPLQANTTYYFRAGSRNHNRILTFAQISATSTLANVPTSPDFFGVFGTSVAVTWGIPEEDAEGYRVEASVQQDFSGLVLSTETPNGELTDLTLIGLNSDSTYYFRIGSLNWNRVPHFRAAGSTLTKLLEDDLPPTPVDDLAALINTETSLELD